MCHYVYVADAHERLSGGPEERQKMDYEVEGFRAASRWPARLVWFAGGILVGWATAVLAVLLLAVFGCSGSCA